MMTKPIVLALAGVLAATSVARAEDDATAPAPAPAPTPMAPSAGGGPFQKGGMGISTGLEGGVPGPNYLMDFVYFLSDKAAIDLLGGIQFAKTPNTAVDPAPDNSVSAFGFAIGLGYRMYTHKGEKIHTYLQPFGLIASSDVSNIGDNFALAIGLNFGAEAFVTDWLSFRGQIGGDFVASSQKDHALGNIELGTTAGAFVDVYWK